MNESRHLRTVSQTCSSSGNLLAFCLKTILCSVLRVLRLFRAQVSSKYVTSYSERLILLFICVNLLLASAKYLRYTVLISPKNNETAVHCCDLALAVFVMLVSRNVFYRWYQPYSLLLNRRPHGCSMQLFEVVTVVLKVPKVLSQVC